MPNRKERDPKQYAHFIRLANPQPVVRREVPFPRSEQLFPTDQNIKRLADIVKAALATSTSDRRFLALSPSVLAMGALGYYAGPPGTGELYAMPLQRVAVENYVAVATIDYNQRNPAALKTSMMAGGLISAQEDRALQARVMMGNIDAVNATILRKLGENMQEIVQGTDPRSSLLVQAFANLTEAVSRTVEASSGQLVGIHHLDALARNLDILGGVDLYPHEVKSDRVSYLLDTLATEPIRTITILMDSPRTVFVAGPGTATGGKLTNFLRFGKGVYADQTRFVANVIGTIAINRGKTVGETLERGDVVTRSVGMGGAAEEFADKIDLAQFAMVQSAPREAIEQALGALGRGMRSGRAVLVLLPDTVAPSETSFESFSEVAAGVGLIRSSFFVDGRELKSFDYSHPNRTPGGEMLDRRAYIGVFRKL